MDNNNIIKVNNLPSILRLEISLKITDKIFANSDREWWEKLELNWKIILLSNYCFNRIKWSLIDCDAMCFLFQWNIQNDLIDFAVSAYGENFDINENIANISNSILNSIIYKTKILWCAETTVADISPIFRIESLQYCKGIKCKLSATDFFILKEQLEYFQGFDPYNNLYYETGNIQTWEEFKVNKNNL